MRITQNRMLFILITQKEVLGQVYYRGNLITAKVTPGFATERWNAREYLLPSDKSSFFYTENQAREILRREVISNYKKYGNIKI